MYSLSISKIRISSHNFIVEHKRYSIHDAKQIQKKGFILWLHTKFRASELTGYSIVFYNKYPHPFTKDQ